MKTPTSTASSREFQATPQREPPDRQSRLQSFALNSFCANAPTEYTPSFVSNALPSIWMIGMKTKSPTTATTKLIEPTTKTSPPTAPRAAIPRLKRNRKADAVSIAP